MALIEVAKDIIAENNLSPHAVNQHATYIAGAQTEILDDLRRVMFIDGPQLANPIDPGNPAEAQWYVGWNSHFEQLKRKKLESTPDRVNGTLAAAGLIVMDYVYEATGEYSQLVVPKLFHVYMPKKYGRISTEAES